MVTISMKMSELLWVCDAITEYGQKGILLRGHMCMSMLKKLKRHITSRENKQLIDLYISKIRDFHKIPPIYRKKGK